jgi:hypothetical protein
VCVQCVFSLCSVCVQCVCNVCAMCVQCVFSVCSVCVQCRKRPPRQPETPSPDNASCNRNIFTLSQCPNTGKPVRNEEKRMLTQFSSVHVSTQSPVAASTQQDPVGAACKKCGMQVRTCGEQEERCRVMIWPRNWDED